MRIRKGTFHNNGSSRLAIPSLDLIPRLLGSYLSIVNHDHFGMNTYHSHNKAKSDLRPVICQTACSVLEEDKIHYKAVPIKDPAVRTGLPAQGRKCC